MTLVTDVEKIRRDVDRISTQVEVNATGVASHEQQISGDRGITDTLQQLSEEIKGLRTELSAVNQKLSAVEKAFADRMTALERAFAEWTAVAKALAEKGVSTRTFVLGVAAILIPIVVFFISSGNHP